MFDDLSERTESPTAHHRAQARRNGDIARSADLTSAAALFGGVILVGLLAPGWAISLRGLLETHLSGRPSTDLGLGTHVLVSCASPLAAGVLLTGLLAGLMQTGFFISPRPLLPDLSRVSPIQGVLRLFSARGVSRLTMGLTKTLVVLSACGVWVVFDLPRVLGLIHSQGPSLGPAIAGLVWRLAMKAASLLLILGLIDFAWQWRLRERSLRMTRWELKEDLKRTEGNPLHKQRRASMTRRASLDRGQEEVENADVVLTSPAGVAVAIRYDRDLDAPRLLAKGAGLSARRICLAAELRGLPVIERPAVARALFRYVDPRRPVPRRFYDEVAETLAYAYRITGRKVA